MSEYASKLEAAKAAYPFQQWADSGLEQYTDQACAAFAGVFDCLISDLIARGHDAAEAAKLEAFQRAVLALNTLNEADESLIETGEREDLCDLVNLIASATGLNPADYGDGEGPASEWRAW